MNKLRSAASASTQQEQARAPMLRPSSEQPRKLPLANLARSKVARRIAEHLPDNCSGGRNSVHLGACRESVADVLASNWPTPTRIRPEPGECRGILASEWRNDPGVDASPRGGCSKGSLSARRAGEVAYGRDGIHQLEYSPPNSAVDECPPARVHGARRSPGPEHAACPMPQSFLELTNSKAPQVQAQRKGAARCGMQRLLWQSWQGIGSAFGMMI